jgi:hypothetical protein|tara:strand:- start:295 stop:498 length:204 start_codon:yes stop_codon:yes gene_type:complete
MRLNSIIGTCVIIIAIFLNYFWLQLSPFPYGMILAAAISIVIISVGVKIIRGCQLCDNYSKKISKKQ